MKTMLLTGFGLWGDERYNTSWDILHGNPLALPGGWETRVEQLPVSWAKVPDRLDDLLADDSIRAVLAFGMCCSRTIKVERLALNLNEPGKPDADGADAPGDYVIPGAPPAYWTGLPFETTLGALIAARVPTEESRCAGGFLCNFAFYHLMHRLAAREIPTIGGFIHVPHYETEGGLPHELLRLAVPVVAAKAAHLADAPELPFV